MLRRWNIWINYFCTIPDLEIEEDDNGRFVEYQDLLPVLREARAIAEELMAQGPHDYERAMRFLDATKGVEG